MAIVIQSLSRSNSLLSQQLVRAKSAMIGRGFRSDINLDDPYVCEQHATVSYNEDNNNISIIDNASLNGMKVNGKAVGQAILNPDDIVTLGQSQFRIFAASQTVAPTRKLNSLDAYLQSLTKKRIFFTLLTAFLGLAFIDSYLNTFTKIEFGMFYSTIIGGVLVLASAPLLISMLAILNKREAQVLTLLNITLLGSLILSLVGYTLSVFNFNLHQPSLIALLETLTLWGLLSLGLWLMLYVAFHQSKRKRGLIVVSCIAVFASIQLLPSMFNPSDFIEAPNIDASIMHPSALLSSPISTDEFIQDAAKLFDKTAQQADK